MLDFVLMRCADMICDCCYCVFFFFKQKTAYELRISDWSSDVCSSDLIGAVEHQQFRAACADGRGREQQRERTEQRPRCAQRRMQCPHGVEPEIGRASSRERVCQYV